MSNTIKYKVTRLVNLKHNVKSMQVDCVFEGTPQKFIELVKAGDVTVWGCEHFDVKPKSVRAGHYVGGVYVGKASGRVDLKLNYQGAFDMDFNGNPTHHVSYFHNLHERMWNVLLNEFSAEELKHIHADVSDVARSDDMVAYGQTFKSTFVLAAKEKPAVGFTDSNGAKYGKR